MIKNLPTFFMPELVATFIYCFYTQMTDSAYGGYLCPLNTGLLVYIIIVFNHTAAVVHFNPAVTAAFYVAKKISLSDVFYYFGAQLVGGLLGSGVAYLCYFMNAQITAEGQVVGFLNNAVDLAAHGNSSYQAIVSLYALDVKLPTADNPFAPHSTIILLSETITTGLLCLLATIAVYNPKTWKDGTGAFCIGLSVFVGITAGAKVGAGCLNPIRSDMPWGFFNWEKLMQNWTFNVGPMLGGIVAGLVYNVMYDEDLCEAVEKKDATDEELQELKK